MLASIPQGRHLSVPEAIICSCSPATGHRRPPSDHVGPGLSRILDRLADTPAEILSELGVPLRKTRLGVALTEDCAHFAGQERSVVYRWITDPASRSPYAESEHAFLSRLRVSGLRDVAVRRGPGSRAARIVDELLTRSDEFRRVWSRQEFGLWPRSVKRFVHPEVG
ncbi:hypothetical protein [Frondihabitans australicus]|uniref:MmyB family transcriptional regulator n=1 Tax=Frondihabitans australicus TaxID=386892 RepID=UPI001FE48438|nr:hypothetical protein [Frondihabitans australicus]